MINTLYILNETSTNGYNAGILDLISLASITCGVFVIVSKNPIVSVLFLIGLFLNIASYLIMLGLSFIGLSYLLVYVGAVSILFLFILMLINVRVSELLSDTSNTIPLVLIISYGFSSSVDQILPYSLSYFRHYIHTFSVSTVNSVIYGSSNDLLSKDLNSLSDNSVIAFVTSRTWDGSVAETSHITTLGNIMYSSYAIWLIITSLVLLLAMVGAIVITIKQTKS